MKIKRPIRKIEQGQATLEMIVLTPYFFYFIFLIFTVAIFWLGYNLNLQAANEAVSAEAAYGGGGAKAAQVGAFGASLNTNVSSVNTVSLSGGFGDILILQTSSEIKEPWEVPLVDIHDRQAIGTSMSPVWRFEPEIN